MKYPNVIFYRFEKYNWIDDYLIEFQDKLEFTINISKNNKHFSYLFNTSKFNMLITFGNNKRDYFNEITEFLPKRFINKWIHYDELPNFETLNDDVNKKYIQNVIEKREKNRPVFSIFTSCYNSYEKILRPYNSLLKQTFIDWEWIIMDDSTQDNHFNFLKDNINDPRVRLYKRAENSGCIGNVKNESVSLCRGKYILELDHDDEIIKELFENAKEVFENDNEIGFIYMDFINIHENGENFKFEGVICKGYAGYYLQKYNDVWRYVYITPNINNITLSYLICCPNHPRIWKRDVLLQLENYSEELPICDDYEILLRTSINTKIAKIHKLGYIQYMNKDENNFSFIRNREINRIGPNYIGKLFYEKYKVHDKMREKNAHEDPCYIDNNNDIWKRVGYTHKYCNSIINLDYDMQCCIIGLNSFNENIDRIKLLYSNGRNDFILLDNKTSIKQLCEKIELLGLDRIKCYSLFNNNDDDMIRYFKLMYLSCINYEIIITEKKTFCNRYEIINNYLKKNDNYLEIGIEHGHTFLNINTLNKIGIDPDPKITHSNIIQVTADEFFLYNDVIFNIIFIDGMHQVEYVINDINNSIRTISNNGKIFIDDILPLTYEEQLKIPNNHFYENGILKYKESWTGDVWKVIYYILKNFKTNIEFKYFLHENYRGVFMFNVTDLFQISKKEINEINGYDYYNDFNKYKKLLDS